MEMDWIIFSEKNQSRLFLLRSIPKFAERYEYNSKQILVVAF
ncbi:hypothetical protein SAMN04488519_10867 [Algoriphagus ornithinivorans]|jgi:hypothetical protein|uniref:Uncharacterized protein n=1 Tax=Algoriphagus ornithinivorans TaxID=226506 RepID=A0A1I5I413_9BACT|nr:hypothetical protein SAMN04488519_10867 [Algoriphagus ornithinivorans]